MNTRPIEGNAVQRQLGELFLRARTMKGVSLKMLAEGMNRSINTIRWHEAGARSLRADDLVLAAQVIGCSPMMLIPDMNGGDPQLRLGWFVDLPQKPLDPTWRPKPKARRRKPVIKEPSHDAAPAA